MGAKLSGRAVGPSALPNSPLEGSRRAADAARAPWRRPAKRGWRKRHPSPPPLGAAAGTGTPARLRPRPHRVSGRKEQASRGGTPTPGWQDRPPHHPPSTRASRADLPHSPKKRRVDGRQDGGTCTDATHRWVVKVTLTGAQHTV